MERTFNWAPAFDEQSRSFPIRGAIAERPKKRNKLWRTGPVLDQGREGACVGFAWAAEALSTPVSVDLSRMKATVPQDPNKFAQFVYEQAKILDPWPGEDYEGTSVHAGVKALRSLGLAKEYRWAFHIDDVVDAILTKGPAVLGIYWYEGMYDAPNGVLEVSGDTVGGHSIAAVGYTVNSPKLGGEDGIILQNSWGPDWGINGLAEIRVSELGKLLGDNGEACIISKRSYGR